MKLGIKVGLKNNSYQDLISAAPDFCEVWFHVNKIADYNNLFSQIKQLKIGAGLHFWGNTSNNTLVNLAYPNKQNLSESIELVKQTINVASKHNCLYVNMHPGSSVLSNVNFERDVIDFKPFGKQISLQLLQETFYNSVHKLANYADNLGIKLIIESVPKYSYSVNSLGQLDRNVYVDFGELPIEIIKTVLNIDNVYFANDFGHTLANQENLARSQLLENLWSVSKKLLTKTKLLHVSYIIPPYNGTDYHGSLLFDEFTSDLAIPNKSEMIKLLSLYKKNDIYALVEPVSDHVGNFQMLKSLLS